MTRHAAFLDMTVSADVDELVADETIGLLSPTDPEALPDSLVLDHERLERALIAYREEFGHERSMNVALLRGSDGEMAFALYPEGNRHSAIVVPPRVRPDGDSEPEVEVADE